MSDANINTILIISAHYYPVKGGTPTHTHYLCKALSELGKNVHLITAGGDAPVTDDVADHDAHLNYTLHRIPTRGKYKDDFFFLWSIRKELPKYLALLHPDIINISTGNFVPLALRFTDVGDIPIVYTVHNVPPEEHPFDHSFGSEVLTSIIRKIYFFGIGQFARITVMHGKYSRLISVSENTKKKLISIGADPNRISVVGNGILIPSSLGIKHHSGVDRLHILTVAGVIEHKGQLDMVYAMQNILRCVPFARYYIVGPVRSMIYREQILSAAKKLGIEHSIVLTGEVSNEELERYYDCCDIYVQPSYQEGFCISILDAMIRGKPVIGTDVGEIATFVKNGRGILLPRPDAEALSLAVLRYVQDPQFCNEAATAGQVFVENNYSWKKIGVDTLHVYSMSTNNL